MNRKFSIIGFLTGLLFILSSCSSDGLKPILTFDQVGKGAYVRLTELIAGEFDLQNFASTSYQYSVEFVDIEKGALITQYDINVTFVDNTAPDNSAGPKLFKSFSASDFTTSANGFKAIENLSIPLSELANLFGLSEDQFTAGDIFRFEGSLTDKNGNVFTAANSSAAVNGSAFQGFFNFTAKVTCPLPDTQFAGAYTLSYDPPIDPNSGFGESLVEGTVTLTTVPGSTTQRQFDATYLQVFGGFAVTVAIDFVCDKVVLLKTDTGVGCDDNILFVQGAEVFPVDINDPNAVIKVQYDEKTAGCGADMTVTMVLTKQ